MRATRVPYLLAAVLAVGCTEGGGSTTGTETGSTSSSGGSTTCAPTGPNVADPTAEAELEGGGTPDFSCYTTPLPLGPSRNVNVRGCVDIFGVGSVVKAGMKLAIYGIDQNPAPGGDAPQYGTVDIVVDPGSDCDSEGRYEASNIPTLTPLIFKTYDTATGANKNAVDTYQYRVVLRPDRHDTDGDGTYEYPANMIFATTYIAIPSTAGKNIEGQNNVSDNVGRGAIAGELRDCQSRSVKNGTAGGSCVLPPQAKVVYFNGAEDPKPDLLRNSTQDDGLFAMLNVATMNDDGSKGRQQELEAKVRANGQVLSAGVQAVRVFPDSVTIFSPDGLLPTTGTPGSSSSSSGAVSSSSAATTSSSAAPASSSAGGTSSSAAPSSSEAGASSSAAPSSSAAGESSSSAAGESSSAAPASSSAAASSSNGNGSSSG